MRALDPEVVDAVWAAVEPQVPDPPGHTLGCHRPRVPDRVCFQGMLVRLVMGCSWEDVERLLGGEVSDTTLRARRDEWINAGIFDALAEEAIDAYDRVLGLDLSEVSIDGSLHKAPCAGRGTGPNPTDRGKSGWKWSLATDRDGIPIGWRIDGANRADCKMLAPTLDDIDERGLLADLETLHLDRGYDSAAVRSRCAEHGLDDLVIAKRRPAGTPKRTQRTIGLGLRWAVERTNSWVGAARSSPDAPEVFPVPRRRKRSRVHLGSVEATDDGGLPALSA